MYPTSARFRQVMAGSHRAVVRARIMSEIQFGANPTGGLELPLAAGNVKMSSTTDIKATLDIEVPGDYWDELRPYGAEIFVERGVDYGDGSPPEYVPLGYFRIEEIQQPKAPAGPIKVTAKDRLAQLKDVRLIYPYQYPAGLSHRTMFQRMVNGYTNPTGFNGGPLLISYGMYFPVNVPIIFEGYDGDRAALPAGMVEDDIYEWMADVVDARGCVVRFDRLGQLVVTSRDRDPAEPAVYSIGPGPQGNLLSASRSLTRAGVYNIVVARGSDPAKATSRRLAYNNDEDSLLYWQGKFGPIPRHYASPLLETSGEAQAAANTLLTRYAGLPSGLAVATLPDPSLDPLDPITVQVGTEMQDHLIDELTIPLAGSSNGVQVVTRTKNQVPTDEDGGGIDEPGGGEEPGGGGGTDPGTEGPPIYQPKFRDGAAFPTFTEPAGNQPIAVANTSELTSKLGSAAPGQTLILANGTYNPGILTVTKKGTPTQPIVIKALNPGQVKFATGSGFSLRGEYVLVKDIDKESDDSGKSFALEGAAKFCGYEGVVVGPTSLAGPQATAAKSLHFYVGGTASDCFITFCETKNKSKPGNGVLVDGDFSTSKACRHILIDHVYFHDYGTEVVNDFEAIRYGVSTMQTTVVDAAIIRCVFERIKSEPEIISLKACGIQSWGHTVRECVGSLSIRHGDDNFHRDSYVFGSTTGANGTKSGGARVYGKRNDISYMYFFELNGSGYEATLAIDGGDTSSPTNGHQNVVGGNFSNNIAVNCVTGAVIGEHYSAAPNSITVKDNIFVNCGGTAVRQVKAPTGTNNISNNVHYTTTAEAGLTQTEVTGGQGSGSTPGAFIAQLFVSPTGSDSNAGTSVTQPKRTIPAAITAAVAGQTISVANGTYPAFETSKGGSSGGGHITVRAANKHGAKLTGDLLIKHEYFTLQDFEIVGQQFACDVTADHTKVLGNRIHDTALSGPQGGNGGSAIEVYSADGNYGPMNDVVIEGNIIYNIGNGVGANQLVQGIYITGNGGSTCFVRNNVIYNVTDFGVHGYSSSGSTQGWVIQNNTVVGCGRGILTTGACTVRNNISGNHKSDNYDIRAGGTISNNLQFGTGNVTQSGVTTTSSPGFADLAGRDLRLATGSPAIDAGTATGAPSTDVLGATRPQAAAVDIGAYEFVVAAPVGDGIFRKTGFGARLKMLSSADVGRGGNRADGTGPSVGGAGGGTGGGVPAKVQAAQAILDRMRSGAAIFEDWTWTPGMPAIVNDHNDALLNLFEQETGTYVFPDDITSGQAPTWLQNYVASNGATGGGSTESATTIAGLLKFGTGPGLAKFDIGIGFAPGDDRGPAGDGVGKVSGAVHRNYPLSRIVSGLSIPGYYELTTDRTAAKLSAHLDGGRTSEKTQYPRVEWREYDIDGVTKMAFDPNKGIHYIIHKFIVDRMPPDKPELVVAQYHDQPDDTAMVRFRNKTTVEAKLGDTVLGNLTTSHVLGQTYTAMIKIEPEVSERTQAAQLILERITSGQSITEDWTWPGVPDIVNTHNEALTAQFIQETGPYSFPADLQSGQISTWLRGYINANSLGTGKCRLAYFWQDMVAPKFRTSYAVRSLGWYAKAGDYAQSNSSIDAVEDGPFIVRTLGIGHWHSRSPLSANPWPEPLGLKP